MRRTVFRLAVVTLTLGACAGNLEPEREQAVAQETDAVLLSVPSLATKWMMRTEALGAEDVLS